MPEITVIAAAVLLLTAVAGGYLVRRALRPSRQQAGLTAALTLHQAGKRHLLTPRQHELLREHFYGKWVASGDPSDLEQSLLEMEK